MSANYDILTVHTFILWDSLPCYPRYGPDGEGPSLVGRAWHAAGRLKTGLLKARAGRKKQSDIKQLLL